MKWNSLQALSALPRKRAARLAAASAIAALSGCNLLDFWSPEAPSGDPPGARVPLGTSLLIQVQDADGEPIPSAVVRMGDIQELTDGAGRVLLEELAAGRVTARVEAIGRVPASVAVDIPPGGHVGAQVNMLPLSEPIPFDAEAGGALSRDGAGIVIGPNSIVDQNGEAVTGPVEATIVPIDLKKLGPAVLPGALEGMPAVSGAPVNLVSVIMADVSLWKDGEPLQLLPGTKAQLELVVPDELAVEYAVGDVVAAWWLDLDAALWREEGYGVMQPSSLMPGKLAWVAEVGHLTTWNSDKPWTEKSCLDVRVVDADLKPLPNLPVITEGVSYNGYSSTEYTDADGHACVEMMLGGKARVYAGHLGAPLGAVEVVTGSGTAADCYGSGGTCTPLELVIPTGSVCTPGSFNACPYTGPPGTENKGICKAAADFCDTLGLGWSGCSGEVLPSVESCSTPFDDDCDGLVNEEGQGCLCAPGDPFECYTGPAGTAGVGSCVTGERICNLNGKGFGPCIGQVVPRPEACSTPGDDDCDGTLLEGGAHGFSWMPGSGPGDEFVLSLAVSGGGDIWVTGSFAGTVAFGPDVLASSSSTDPDVFLARLDASGKALWSKRFGEAATAQIGTAVAVDPAGGAAVVGRFDGIMDVGLGPLTSAGADVFVARVDADGAPLFAARFGDAMEQLATDVKIDSGKNMVVLGELQGTIDFGCGPLTSAGTSDVFVVKLSPEGTCKWSRRYGDGGAQKAARLAVDALDNIVITGYFNGSLDFGGAPLQSAPNVDIFVAKLSPFGDHLFSARYGGAGNDYGTSVATDPKGNVVLTGFTSSPTIDLGGGPLTPSGTDALLVKLSSAGEWQWSKLFGMGGITQAFGLAAGKDGTIAVTGALLGGADFGCGPLTSSASFDAFLADFGEDGGLLWAKQFQGSADEYGYHAAQDASGRIVISGRVNGDIDLGGGPLTSSSGSKWNIFIAGFSP